MIMNKPVTTLERNLPLSLVRVHCVAMAFAITLPWLGSDEGRGIPQIGV